MKKRLQLLGGTALLIIAMSSLSFADMCGSRMGGGMMSRGSMEMGQRGGHTAGNMMHGSSMGMGQRENSHMNGRYYTRQDTHDRQSTQTKDQTTQDPTQMSAQ